MAIYDNKFETLVVNFDQGILEIEISRPKIKNAFNEVMITELDELFTSVDGDPMVRAVVMTGQGDVFCAGGDLNWMKRSIGLSFVENQTDTRRLTNMFKRMNECSKPLIIAAHGAALGGGVGVVSVGDYVVAEKNTQFSLSEVRLGVVPACIGPFVISKIGAGNARALFLSAKRFKADEAYRVGLVHEVVSGADETKKRAKEIAMGMLECGPEALATAKKMILDLTLSERRSDLGNVYDFVSDVLANLRIKPEAQEGLSAFLEKRKPQWPES